MNKTEIILELTRINNNYGRGSIKNVSFDLNKIPTRGTIERMISTSQHKGFLEKRVFRIDENFTLHYLGHQHKLNITLH